MWNTVFHIFIYYLFTSLWEPVSFPTISTYLNMCLHINNSPNYVWKCIHAYTHIYTSTYMHLYVYIQYNFTCYTSFYKSIFCLNFMSEILSMKHTALATWH